MSKLTLIKVIFMSFFLFAVLYLMFVIKKNGLGNFGEMFEESHERKVKVIIQNHLNWCVTRIKSIEHQSGVKIQEENLQWKQISPKKFNINSQEVENWFGRHCTLEVKNKPYYMVAADELEPILRITFVNGETGTFFISNKSFFGWRGERFESQQLQTATQEIVEIMQIEYSSQ